jgi:hypothetical protein
MKPFGAGRLACVDHSTKAPLTTKVINGSTGISHNQVVSKPDSFTGRVALA